MHALTRTWRYVLRQSFGPLNHYLLLGDGSGDSDTIYLALGKTASTQRRHVAIS
jgi:hypothetical protein